MQHPPEPPLALMGKEKPTNTKNFGRTPPGLCPICPVDMSHLSRHLSRLFPADILPLNVNFHIDRPKRPGCPWGRPEFIPGTLPGHFHHQIPLCDFSLSVSCSP